MRLIDADNLIKTLNSAKYIGADSFSKIQNAEIDRCISFVETEPTVPTVTVCSTRIASVVDLFGNRIEGYFDESRMLFFSGYGIVTAELLKQKNYKLIFEEEQFGGKEE